MAQTPIKEPYNMDTLVLAAVGCTDGELSAWCCITAQAAVNLQKQGVALSQQAISDEADAIFDRMRDASSTTRRAIWQWCLCKGECAGGACQPGSGTGQPGPMGGQAPGGPSIPGGPIVPQVPGGPMAPGGGGPAQPQGPSLQALRATVCSASGSALLTMFETAASTVAGIPFIGQDAASMAAGAAALKKKCAAGTPFTVEDQATVCQMLKTWTWITASQPWLWVNLQTVGLATVWYELWDYCDIGGPVPNIPNFPKGSVPSASFTNVGGGGGGQGSNFFPPQAPAGTGGFLPSQGYVPTGQQQGGLGISLSDAMGGLNQDWGQAANQAMDQWGPTIAGAGESLGFDMSDWYGQQPPSQQQGFGFAPGGQGYGPPPQGPPKDFHDEGQAIGKVVGTIGGAIVDAVFGTGGKGMAVGSAVGEGAGWLVEEIITWL